MRKNQFGGRKVVGQATMLARWAQKMGGRLPSSLRRQCLSPTRPRTFEFCHVQVDVERRPVCQ